MISKILLKQCIEECRKCIIHCKKMGGMTKCIEVCEDCIQCCKMCMSVTLHKNDTYLHLIRMCLCACANCAKECEKHDDKEFQKCAKSCRIVSKMTSKSKYSRKTMKRRMHGGTSNIAIPPAGYAVPLSQGLGGSPLLEQDTGTYAAEYAN